ncbi:hypothetical protein TWF281_009593 [Arthrobotrys megalospora]
MLISTEFIKGDDTISDDYNIIVEDALGQIKHLRNPLCFCPEAPTEPRTMAALTYVWNARRRRRVVACFVVWKRSSKGELKGKVAYDIRQLNAVAATNTRPLPRQEDMIEALRGKKWISILDIKFTFRHLDVHKWDRWKSIVASQP